MGSEMCIRDRLGNVRELRNTLHRATALATKDELDLTLMLPAATRTTTPPPTNTTVITPDASPVSPASSPLPPVSLDTALTLGELERQHILRVLDEANHNRERAAGILGISARTLYRKLREYEA